MILARIPADPPVQFPCVYPQNHLTAAFCFRKQFV